MKTRECLISTAPDTNAQAAGSGGTRVPDFVGPSMRAGQLEPGVAGGDGRLEEAVRSSGVRQVFEGVG
jgi:hypothetical protein